MDRLFQNTNAYWVKYSGYEYRSGDDGNLYILPASGAKPSVYDPMKDAGALVVDALNVGRLAMKQGGGEKALQKAVLGFVTKYGLLGFMTALPTTVEFLNYDAVYLPKNHFIRDETMATKDYLSLYYPFGKPDIYKDKEKVQWNVSSDEYKDMSVLAVAQTFFSEPIAVGASLMPNYAERYDWLTEQFRDWGSMLVSAFLFYEDKDKLDEFTLDIYRKGVSAFSSRAPTYHVAMYDDRPKIVWDFHSLLLTIQTMFGFALTDEARPLRLCKHCNQAFIAGHPGAAFCSAECKNKYNVYKSRGKKKQDADD